MEIRNWDKPQQWDTVEVRVERFPSGALEIAQGNQLRHYKDVRKWIRKVRDEERARDAD